MVGDVHAAVPGGRRKEWLEEHNTRVRYANNIPVCAGTMAVLVFRRIISGLFSIVSVQAVFWIQPSASDQGVLRCEFFCFSAGFLAPCKSVDIGGRRVHGGGRWF